MNSKILEVWHNLNKLNINIFSHLNKKKNGFTIIYIYIYIMCQTSKV